MRSEERWREVGKAHEMEQAEGEVENGHELGANLVEISEDKEGDELTGEYTGEIPRDGPDGIYVEVPSGAAATPQEVQGISQEVIEEYQKRRLPIPDQDA